MVLAARGARNLDTGEERIADSAVEVQLRRQARKVHIKSILMALLMTAFCLLVST